MEGREHGTVQMGKKTRKCKCVCVAIHESERMKA